MAFDDLKALIDILFHVFMINEVLLKLFSELTAQGLDVIQL